MLQEALPYSLLAFLLGQTTNSGCHTKYLSLSRNQIYQSSSLMFFGMALKAFRQRMAHRALVAHGSRGKPLTPGSRRRDYKDGARCNLPVPKNAFRVVPGVIWRN